MRILAAALAFAVASQAGPAPAAAITIDVASTFPSSLPILGDAVRRLAANVERATGGDVVLRFHEPGAIVPGAESVAAVAAGRVAAAWSGAGWFAGADSAFHFFSTVPFGPSISEYMAWMYGGGGLELARDMFHAHGIHNIPCGMIPPEASGWFRREIRSVEDLRGLRMRFFGLGALVMQKLGVETLEMAPGEILGGFRNGTLDAAEFSLPAMDERLGLQDVAKIYYFPGWHQQATFFDLYIQRAVWDGLPDRARAVIELACGDVVREMIATGEAAQGAAIARLEATGVQVRRWPARILVAMEAAWLEVVAEESARNDNFRRVHESYSRFRESYRPWRYLSYLQ